MGQAVVIRAWEYDDGTKGGIAADEERAAVEQAAAAGPPAAGELEAAGAPAPNRALAAACQHRLARAACKPAIHPARRRAARCS